MVVASVNERGSVVVDDSRLVLSSAGEGFPVVGWYGETVVDRRCNGRCKCGRPVSVLVPSVVRERTRQEGHGMYARTVTDRQYRAYVRVGDQTADYLYQHRCGCGRLVQVRPVAGVFRAEVPCDARCTSAKGHKCECSCGGANHGMDHQH